VTPPVQWHHDCMAYRELPPPRELAAVVRCLWEREAEADEHVLVMPDGCVDVVARDGRAEIAGPDTGPVVVRLRRGDLIAGVRFRPGAADAALGVPADALRDCRVALEDLWGADGRIAGERAQGGAAALAAALARRLGDAPDPRVLCAAALLARAPATPVPAAAGAVGLGDRQLRRRVTAAVGYGPRTFARIARFRAAIALLERGEPLARAAAEAGYADQAHMTREIGALAGRTPAALTPR
jgi:AraC-like DNA-binding protein